MFATTRALNCEGDSERGGVLSKHRGLFAVKLLLVYSGAFGPGRPSRNPHSRRRRRRPRSRGGVSGLSPVCGVRFDGWRPQDVPGRQRPRDALPPARRGARPPPREAPPAAVAIDVAVARRANSYNMCQSETAYNPFDWDADGRAAFSSDLLVMSRVFSSMDLFESFTKDSYLQERMGSVPHVELEPASPQDRHRLVQRMDELNLDNTGTFWHSDGSELPW